MTIAVVGIGLDGEKGLSISAREVIDRATVLAGSKRHLSYFAEHSAEKLDLANLDRGIDAIARFNSDNSVVVLASGDPLFFGLGRLLLTKLDPATVTFYPHLTSVQLAFNRLKIPWQNAELVSVHGRSTDKLVKLLKQGKEKIAVLTDAKNNPKAIAQLFLSLELPIDYSFNICENLGSSEEKISKFSPLEITKLSQLDEQNFANLNVLILIREAQQDNLNLATLPLIGLPDSSFLSFSDRPGLITKKEVRLAILGELALQPQQIVWDIGAGTGSVSVEIARLCPTSQIYAVEKTSIGSSLITKKEVRLAILGELSLQPQQIVWDIGAGTGSVSVEIARLCPSSQIYAVEKTSMGSSLISKNSQRFQVNNIISINGKAPDVLQDLPNCDRVFIGGSGGNIVDILNTCSQKLKEKGSIVMAFATIEYQLQAIDWLSNNNWQYRLLQLQISRSTPISHLTRMTPLNPVTIITSFR